MTVRIAERASTIMDWKAFAAAGSVTPPRDPDEEEEDEDDEAEEEDADEPAVVREPDED